MLSVRLGDCGPALSDLHNQRGRLRLGPARPALAQLIVTANVILTDHLIGAYRARPS